MFAPIATLGVPAAAPEVDERQLVRLVGELSRAVDRLQEEIAELKRRS